MLLASNVKSLLVAYFGRTQETRANNRLVQICFAESRDFKIKRRDALKKNNSFALASHFFVHFFAVFAQQLRENA